MKTIFLPIILSLVLVSCSFLRQNTQAVESFTYCFNDEYTGLDTLLNINGFYYSVYNLSMDEKNKNIQIHDTIYPSFAFFKNGMYVSNLCVDCLQNIKIQSIGGEWGLYTLCGDTIKAQFIEPPSSMSFTKGEIWFKIIDKNTVQPLGTKYQTPMKSDDIKQVRNNKQSIKLCKFTPLYALPDPNKSWIINEKWFWCNEEAYKRWKEDNR